MLTTRLMALGPVLWDETTDLERVMKIARANLTGPLAGEMFAALGSGHMFLGEPEEADEAFKQALSHFAAGDPAAQTAAKLGMATALDAQAKWSAAAAEYRSFLATASEHPVARVSEANEVGVGSAVDWATERLSALEGQTPVD
jgi:hypothetical protein